MFHCTRARRSLAAVALSAAVFAGATLLTPSHRATAAEPTATDATQQPKDIIDTAVGPNMEQVTTVVAAIKAAGLVDTLKGKGPFTVFAPTNAAFAALPAGTVDNLLKP